MLYSYRAVDQTGKTFSAEREAGSERELADLLRRERFWLLEAGASRKTAIATPVLAWASNLFGRVTLVERMIFSRNLAVMIGAGLSVTRALEALAEQSANPKFRAILTAIRQAVIGGQSLADGLRPHEAVFGPLFISMVESGEISGNLERVLKILARQMKRDHDIRSRVRGAMLYPAVVFGALVLVGVLMMVYVVPTLTQTFTELGIDLPLTTRLIIGSSRFLLNYSWYLAIAAVIAAAGAFRVIRSPRGKTVFDTLILRVPVFGPLVKELNAARFARILSSLITAGVSITKALEVTAAVLGNVHFRASLRDASVAIQRGQALSEIFKKRADLFPPMVTEMIHVGEETGTTARMLLRLARFYEEEVASTTKNLSSIIEPVLMIVVGAIVGFFAVSMIQPIYSGLGNL